MLIIAILMAVAIVLMIDAMLGNSPPSTSNGAPPPVDEAGDDPKADIRDKR